MALNIKILTILIGFTILVGSTGTAFGVGILASPGGFNVNFGTTKTYQGQLTVENIGNEPLNITVDKKRIQKDNVNVVFSDNGAATWIEVNPSSFVLGPHQKGSVNFIVNVPSNVSYYDAAAALLIQGHSINSKINENNSLNIQRIPELIVPIYIGLPGDIIESLELLDHKVPSILLSFMPGKFEYTLKNNGTVVANIDGNVEINGWLSKHNVTMSGNVFPGDNYNMFTKWEPDFWDFGVYNAKTVIKYGRETQDKTIETDDTIVVIPVWLIIILLMILMMGFIRKKEISSPIKIKIEKKKKE